MKTTLDFLDDLRVALGVPGQPVSDYEVSKRLGVSKQTISRYRTGKTGFDDAVARRVAFLLDLPAAYVVACVHHERETQLEGKDVWKYIADNVYSMWSELRGWAPPQPNTQYVNLSNVPPELVDSMRGTVGGNATLSANGMFNDRQGGVMLKKKSRKVASRAAAALAIMAVGAGCVALPEQAFAAEAATVYYVKL